MVHCAYAFMLAFSSIYMAISTPATEAQFLKVLNNNQTDIYKQIRTERLQIYLQSLLLGFLFAIIYYTRVKQDKCYFLAIALTLTPMFYMIMPKSQNMIDHIFEDQMKALDKMRKEQQTNGTTSSLLALGIWIVSSTVKCKQ